MSRYAYGDERTVPVGLGAEKAKTRRDRKPKRYSVSTLFRGITGYNGDRRQIDDLIEHFGVQINERYVVNGKEYRWVTAAEADRVVELIKAKHVEIDPTVRDLESHGSQAVAIQ